MNIEIANRLINLRKQSGLSQEELAARLGLSRQAVSKWERAEASPDTDNLICLAKIYGVSLDDLLNTDQPVEDIAREVKEKEAARPEEPKTPRIDSLIGEKGLTFSWFSFDPYGFHSVKPTGRSLLFYDKDGNLIPTDSIMEQNIANANGTAVSIERDEINVAVADGGAIHIEPDEVKIKTTSGENTHYSIDDDGRITMEKEYSKSLLEAILVPATVFLSTIAYLLLGFFLPNNTGWQYWWVVFFLIPIVAQLCSMVRTKTLNTFPMVFFCCIAFFLTSFYTGYWHPMWVVFLLVPLYHAVVSPIDHTLRTKRKEKKEKELQQQNEE